MSKKHVLAASPVAQTPAVSAITEQSSNLEMSTMSKETIAAPAAKTKRKKAIIGLGEKAMPKLAEFPPVLESLDVPSVALTNEDSTPAMEPVETGNSNETPNPVRKIAMSRHANISAPSVEDQQPEPVAKAKRQYQRTDYGARLDEFCAAHKKYNGKISDIATEMGISVFVANAFDRKRLKRLQGEDEEPRRNVFRVGADGKISITPALIAQANLAEQLTAGTELVWNPVGNGLWIAPRGEDVAAITAAVNAMLSSRQSATNQGAA